MGKAIAGDAKLAGSGAVVRKKVLQQSSAEYFKKLVSP